MASVAIGSGEPWMAIGARATDGCLRPSISEVARMASRANCRAQDALLHFLDSRHLRPPHQPAHAAQVGQAHPQAVQHPVFGHAARARTVADRHADALVTGAFKYGMLDRLW